MRDHDDSMRYTLELEMLERHAVLGSRRGAELLRAEFALALNASYLIHLSAGEIEVGAIWRSVLPHGMTRYVVELVLEERRPGMTDEQAAELVQREFALAQNASHFLRVSRDDFGARLVARERAGAGVHLRAA